MYGKITIHKYAIERWMYRYILLYREINACMRRVWMSTARVYYCCASAFFRSFIVCFETDPFWCCYSILDRVYMYFDFYAVLLSTYDKINANKLIRDPTVNTYNAQLLRWRLIQTKFKYSNPKKKSQFQKRQHFASE